MEVRYTYEMGYESYEVMAERRELEDEAWDRLVNQFGDIESPADEEEIA